MVALILRVGLGVCLLNGGLLGYLTAQRGGASASGLVWSTLLGPSSVASVLEHDMLVPYVQIALGLALILGFFTVVSAVLAGFLVLSGPIFQFLAILSHSGQSGNAALEMQAMMVTTGSINLLLLIAAVLWLTPIEGTPWSLDAVIFARPRPPRSTAAPAPEQVPVPVPVPDSAPTPAEAPTAELSPAGTGTASLSASHGE
jgi:hypothetical protein